MSAFAHAVCASVIWGIVPIIEKYAIDRSAPMSGLFLRSAGVMLASFALFAFPGMSSGLRAMDWRMSGLFILAGALASVFGQIFAYHAIRAADASRVAPIMGSWPVLVVIFGWLFLNEPVTLRTAVGTILVVTGVWVLRF